MAANGNYLDNELELRKPLQPASWLQTILETGVIFVEDLGRAYSAAAEYADLTSHLPRDAAANVVARQYCNRAEGVVVLSAKKN